MSSGFSGCLFLGELFDPAQTRLEHGATFGQIAGKHEGSEGVAHERFIAVFEQLQMDVLIVGKRETRPEKFVGGFGDQRPAFGGEQFVEELLSFELARIDVARRRCGDDAIGFGRRFLLVFVVCPGTGIGAGLGREERFEGCAMVFVRARLFALGFVPRRTAVFRIARVGRNFRVVPDLRLVFSYPPHHYVRPCCFREARRRCVHAVVRRQVEARCAPREIYAVTALAGGIVCRVVFSSALAIRAGRARLQEQRACVENPSCITPIHERRRKLGPPVQLVK